MPLLKNGEEVGDPWIDLADDAALPASGPVIVSLARWKAERDALIARGENVGVRLANTVNVAELAADLARFALVVLAFPKFNDGRAFSQARLLRERYRFAGEIRATGAVLRDQLLFMQRCGFDAFAIADPGAADAWTKAMREIGVFYQPTGDGRATVRALRHIAPQPAARRPAGAIQGGV